MKNVHSPISSHFRTLGDALDRLGEVLSVPEDQTSYLKDAAIQRFEFCFELFWKLFKKICEQEGFEVISPKSALQGAYQLQLIDDEKSWIDMMLDRNLTSHSYKQDIANQIYQREKKYYPLMKTAYDHIQNRYS